MTLPIEGEWHLGPMTVGMHNREYQWSDWPTFARVFRTRGAVTLRVGRFVAILRWPFNAV